MSSEKYLEFKNAFLIDYFKLLTESSLPAEKFNNWFLTIIGATIGILIYQLNVLSLYFDLSTLGWIFFGLTLSGCMGIISKFFSYMAGISYKGAQNFSDPSLFSNLPDNSSEEEVLEVLRKDIPNEIQQRIFPKIFIRITHFVFNKCFSMLDNRSLPYEISAKSVVLQLLFVEFEITIYFVSILIAGILFIAH